MIFLLLSDNNLLFCIILLLDVVYGLLDMLGYGTLSRRLKTIRKDIRCHVQRPANILFSFTILAMRSTC